MSSESPFCGPGQGLMLRQGLGGRSPNPDTFLLLSAEKCTVLFIALCCWQQGERDLLFLFWYGGVLVAAVDCQAFMVADVTQGSRGDRRESCGSSAIVAHDTKPSS